MRLIKVFVMDYVAYLQVLGKTPLAGPKLPTESIHQVVNIIKDDGIRIFSSSLTDIVMIGAIVR